MEIPRKIDSSAKSTREEHREQEEALTSEPVVIMRDKSRNNAKEPNISLTKNLLNISMDSYKGLAWITMWHLSIGVILVVIGFLAYASQVTNNSSVEELISIQNQVHFVFLVVFLTVSMFVAQYIYLLFSVENSRLFYLAKALKIALLLILTSIYCFISYFIFSELQNVLFNLKVNFLDLRASFIFILLFCVLLGIIGISLICLKQQEKVEKTEIIPIKSYKKKHIVSAVLIFFTFFICSLFYFFVFLSVDNIQFLEKAASTLRAPN
ncbi:hypothetical protein NEFER03_1556 [Nematocida sp. LUAm3]|nr:hypothetical protein NEFER03_1556 [Nematocida sp. LUAm3]KAI5174589.1 hypothetical protein NEFER02_0710 [Nematocida sp. LUAm2]KAI5178005.1 hypothetical protein NEFER01_1187 [Nematocida sp. LUAm1]